jgi:CelD/BcsL family acetyltransferase involved in cellulose biosynthesis
LHITLVAGFPETLDMLAATSLSRHGFLRAAWFRAAAAERGATLVATRADGSPVAAIATTARWPRVQSLRMVPGSYWPLRNVLVADDARPAEIASLFTSPAADALGRLWRLGPVPEQDPSFLLIADAAEQAGWRVLCRPAGQNWSIDIEALKAQGWPRRSTAKRLAKYANRLNEHGAVSWEYVNGTGWNDSVLNELGAVESESWIASRTDGSGAKFLKPAQRALWKEVLTDPVLAAALHATILRINGRAVGFSFDLDDGATRYGIAGSYIHALRNLNVGTLVNYRTLEDAIRLGLSRLDLGVGDNGYKREMGALAGDKMTDVLFVRDRFPASVIRRWWCGHSDGRTKVTHERTSGHQAPET